MLKRKRTLIVMGVLLLIVVVEVGLNAWKPSVAGVRGGNQGDAPIVNLQVVYGDSKTSVDQILPQESAEVRIVGHGQRGLKLRFKQLNNALSDFEVADFDPGFMSREKSVLVLEIRNGEFTRSLDVDKTPTTLGRLSRNVWRWLGEEEEEP